MNENAAYIPTLLGFALLGLLHQKPRSGYDIRNEMEAYPIGHFSNSPGSIYPALQQLKKHGLIDGRIVHRTRLKPREVFRLTFKGITIVKQWLTTSITSTDVKYKLSELMLRFRFMENLTERSDTTHFLHDFIKLAEDYVKTLQGQAEQNELASSYVRLLSNRDIALYQMHIEWAKQALIEFSASSTNAQPGLS